MGVAHLYVFGEGRVVYSSRGVKHYDSVGSLRGPNQISGSEARLAVPSLKSTMPRTGFAKAHVSKGETWGTRRNARPRRRS
jgi:hypothetical protein